MSGLMTSPSICTDGPREEKPATSGVGGMRGSLAAGTTKLTVAPLVLA